MKVLVQKFGGTSLATKDNRRLVINHIKKAIQNYEKIIVIVSAIGRKPSPYATDTLLSLVNYPHSFSSNRELDLLMSCGEIISSVVLSNELKEQNLSSIAITGSQAGIVTTEEFMDARIKYIQPKNLLKLMQTYNVIVVAGFQGETLSKEVTTLGRGGSDITAAAIGVAMDAEKIEIFTDVSGVMTADPKIVPKATPIKVATYIEISNLAYQGAKVIHPRAIEIAMKEKIPIHIRSTYDEDGGTLITTAERKQQFAINERIITGITYKTGLVKITIDLKENPSIFQTEIFKEMSKAGISVDFIHISPTNITYTIPKQLSEKALHILETLNIQPRIDSNCVKVSVVGSNMSGTPGVISTIVESLTDDGIDILQSSDHYTSIWVLIDEKHLQKAINNLHRAFHLESSSV